MPCLLSWLTHSVELEKEFNKHFEGISISKVSYICVPKWRKTLLAYFIVLYLTASFPHRTFIALWELFWGILFWYWRHFPCSLLCLVLLLWLGYTQFCNGGNKKPRKVSYLSFLNLNSSQVARFVAVLSLCRSE